MGSGTNHTTLQGGGKRQQFMTGEREQDSSVLVKSFKAIGLGSLIFRIPVESLSLLGLLRNVALWEWLPEKQAARSEFVADFRLRGLSASGIPRLGTTTFSTTTTTSTPTPKFILSLHRHLPYHLQCSFTTGCCGINTLTRRALLPVWEHVNTCATRHMDWTAATELET